MPGGPVATGGGIGANAPKSKLAGILMVCPSYPLLAFLGPFLILLFSLKRLLLLHSVVFSSVMIPVPSLAFSRCQTGFVPLATLFPSHLASPMATVSRPLSGLL